MEDVLRGIVQSEYVVADLTGKNPNVFYELGIAHSCKDASKVIMIAQSIEDIPFDLRPMRCIIYSTDGAGLRKLRLDLIRSMRSDILRFSILDQGTYDFDRNLAGYHRIF